MSAKDILADAVLTGQVDLAELCSHVATEKGFRGVVIDPESARRFKGLVHIADEIEEFEVEIFRNNREAAAEELADCVILLADISPYPIFLSEIDGSVFDPPPNVFRWYARLFRAAYKHGFMSTEWITAYQSFLACLVCEGSRYTSGAMEFRKVILDKCAKNLKRKHLFGVPEGK